MWNGEIISYVISDRPDLKMVVDIHPHTNGLIMHSDQGWHYQHTRYQYLLKEHGITQSMSRKGNCLDNSVMENFFGLMKNELLYNNRWENINDFKAALKEYKTKIENEPGTIPNSLSRSSQIDLIIRPTFWGHLKREPSL